MHGSFAPFSFKEGDTLLKIYTTLQIPISKNYLYFFLSVLCLLIVNHVYILTENTKPE